MKKLLILILGLTLILFSTQSFAMEEEAKKKEPAAPTIAAEMVRKALEEAEKKLKAEKEEPPVEEPKPTPEEIAEMLKEAEEVEREEEEKQLNNFATALYSIGG